MNDTFELQLHAMTAMQLHFYRKGLEFLLSIWQKYESEIFEPDCSGVWECSASPNEHIGPRNLQRTPA
jgi:hypothetical protein